LSFCGSPSVQVRQALREIGKPGEISSDEQARIVFERCAMLLQQKRHQKHLTVFCLICPADDLARAMAGGLEYFETAARRATEAVAAGELDSLYQLSFVRIGQDAGLSSLRNEGES
jgi:hypothetical protein